MTHGSVRLLGALALTFTMAAPAVSRADETGTEQRSQLGVGARVRYVSLPTAMLNLFLDHSTPMNSLGVGLEVVRRKANFDVVFGLEYENISPEDGLYLDKGDNPSNCVVGDTCPDYVHFDGLALLGLDASFIWHTNLVAGLQLRYGAGVGVAYLMGDVERYRLLGSCPAGTTASDLDDVEACGGHQSAAYDDGLPTPVVPIVNVLLGLRYKINPQLALDLEGGFRDVFFLGLGTNYVF